MSVPSPLDSLQHPILLAPMAGAADILLAIAVARGGGLGSLACAMLGPDQIRSQVALFRAEVPGAPLNLNFFCHTPPVPDRSIEDAWNLRLMPYFQEFGIDPSMPVSAASRQPFDAAACELVEELRPELVSFHFGLPVLPLLERVRACGSWIVSSATTVDEAIWLEDHGCDAVIAQGLQAGGHRGYFLRDSLDGQAATLDLLAAMVSAVKLPVIAAGGLGTAGQIAAALASGARAVQLGTAYLLCPESTISAAHRSALREKSRPTAITNLFSGRPARGLLNRFMREQGPMCPSVPAFPQASRSLNPLRAADPDGFAPLWAGEAYTECQEISAAALTAELGRKAADWLVQE